MIKKSYVFPNFYSHIERFRSENSFLQSLIWKSLTIGSRFFISHPNVWHSPSQIWNLDINQVISSYKILFCDHYFSIFSLEPIGGKINLCHCGNLRAFVTGHPKYVLTFVARQKNNQCHGTPDWLVRRPRIFYTQFREQIAILHNLAVITTLRKLMRWRWNLLFCYKTEWTRRWLNGMA